MEKPYPLEQGSTIGIFSPADPLNEQRIRRIEKGISILQSWGFNVEAPTVKQLNAWTKFRPPTERAIEITELLNDDSIDALFASWGGKNCNDLLDLFDYRQFRDLKKPIFGVSDIAVLLNAISYNSRIITFYGPNILGKLDETNAKGLELLNSDSDLKNILPKNVSYTIIRDGNCEGRLIGGSLGTFVLGLSGTKHFPAFKNSILFWETSSLNLFQIRQHLQHLKLANIFQNIKGVIIGATNQILNHEDNFHEMILDLFQNPEIPLIKGDFFGHGHFENPIFPIGAYAYLSTNPVELILTEKPVKD